MRDPFDRGSKWMIGHHGDSLLRLGGATGIQSWRAVQAEVVHPRQLPDGLLEVVFADRTEPDLFLVEVVTHADQRVREQLLRDVGLVLIDRRVLPEVLTLVLHQRGNVQVGNAEELQSRLGWTGVRVSWRVVELWRLPAEQLLGAGDVGLLPWVPLTQFSEPPEVVLRQCRQRIDEQAPAEERANLLAVSQVMARLRYNDPGLLALFGGRQVFNDSPLIQELLAERQAETRSKTLHESILWFLTDRFGAVPPEMADRLQAIQDEVRLKELLLWASRCPDLEAFRARLP